MAKEFEVAGFVSNLPDGRVRLEAEGSRLDLSFLALAGGEVVGVCLNAVYPEDEKVTGRREGWVMSLGVRRPWRGKGLAKALLATSFNTPLTIPTSPRATGSSPPRTPTSG